MSEQQQRWSGQSVAGRYLLGNYLGGTDHSAVFATEIVHARSQKAAIKLLPAASIDADRQFARWKALAAVSHPNLLKILDYGKCDFDGAPYLFVVTEFADEDLADILPQRALNADETRGMLEPVIETLAFLHEQDLVHTRVHPGNVLATGDQIKLSSDSLCPKGEAVSFGVPAEGFASPEWGANADSSQDVWSLGATIAAALTQKAPSVGDDGPELPENVAEPFAGIVRECLKKEPGQRISVAGIRSKLNPASVPVIQEAAPVKVEAKKETKKEVPKIDPLAVPLSRVAPPVGAERRADTREQRPPAAGKKSYFLPIMAGAVVLVLLLAVPRLFRQHSDAAPPEATTGTNAAEKAAPSKPVSSSKTAAAPKKDSSGETALTKTSQPAASAAVPPIKPSKSPGDVKKGDVLDQVLPDVSDKSRATIHGTVRISLRVHVNAAGTVDSAEPESPAGSKYFTEQAIKAAKRWQFSSPEVSGRSVESDWLLHFEFTPSATNVRYTQVSP